MRNIKRVALLLLVLLIVPVAGRFVILQGQDQIKDKENYPNLKSPSGAPDGKLKAFKDRLNRLPFGYFDSPELVDPQERAKQITDPQERAKQITDPQERAQRYAKSKAYNDRYARGRKLRWVELGVLNNDWYFGLTSSLPASQSTAIVIGEVVKTSAFTSEDKSRAYSEFVVRVEELLKNDNDEPIRVGELVTTERLGGRIKLAEGQISTYIVAGQGAPDIGKRYVFFLGYNPREDGLRSPREMSRHILTAYEFRQGKVFQLDSPGHEHEGKEVAGFLNEVRRAVVDPSQTQSQ